MKLNEDTKKLIAEHVNALTKKNEGMLFELNIYRWAIRAFIVLLFGGSVLGFFKLQDYLDDRIQKRSEDLSSIVYGSTAQSAGDYSAAIDQYYPFLEKIESPVFRPSEQIRSIYYYRFIQALAADIQVDPNGEFIVKPAFFGLIESKTYKRDLISNNHRWKVDPGIMNAWALCIIKFESSEAKVKEANDFFVKAVEVAERPSDKASNHFALAMMSLAEADSVNAKKHVIKAMEINPRTHGVKEFSGNFKNDLENESPIWERVARVFGKPGISERYEELIKTIIAERGTK